MSHSPSPAAFETIQSRQNGRLKDLRKHFLQVDRASDGLIAIEGPKLLEEALRSGLRVHSIFFREDKSEALQEAVAVAQDVARQPAAPLQFHVAVDAFNRACATDSPQGLAALVEAPRWSIESLLEADRPLLLVLDALQDPGNLGSIVRTAEAFGASGILLTPGTVNPWSQKVLRASAGSTFRLPVVALHDVEVLALLQHNGIPLYACSAQNGTPAAEANFGDRVGLVIGNEGAGISDAVLAHCSATIHIPCPGPVESLNAAVAASILLYEASRQRARESAKAMP